MRAVLLVAALAVSPATLRAEGNVRRGEVIALTHCARCHAVGRHGTSRLAEAPAFRDLHRRYPVDDLAESLAEGIVTGHPTMPEFRLDPDEVGNLIAYLRSLER